MEFKDLLVPQELRVSLESEVIKANLESRVLMGLMESMEPTELKDHRGRREMLARMELMVRMVTQD